MHGATIKTALYVSGVNYAHPREQLTVFTGFWYDTPTLLLTGCTVKAEP
jgi:hypothetical protein